MFFAFVMWHQMISAIVQHTTCTISLILLLLFPLFFWFYLPKHPHINVHKISHQFFFIFSFNLSMRFVVVIPYKYKLKHYNISGVILLLFVVIKELLFLFAKLQFSFNVFLVCLEMINKESVNFFNYYICGFSLTKIK